MLIPDTEIYLSLRVPLRLYQRDVTGLAAEAAAATQLIQMKKTRQKLS